MARHRRHEKAVHRPFGGLQKVGRLGGIEAPPAGCDGELVMERRSESQEALDRLAEREFEHHRDPAIFGGRHRCLPQMVARRLRLRRVEVLDKARGEDLTSLPEEDPLLVAEREDPG